MKTQQELMQVYWGPGGTVDMVKEYNAKHGCDVRPWKCIRLGDNLIERHPSFGFPPDYYTFALTILYDDRLKEHRPVFVGDNIYCITGNGEPWTVSAIAAIAKPSAWDKWSWNPPTPKRTFKLDFTEEERKVLMCLTSMSQSPVLVDLHNKFTAAARDKE